MDEQLDAAGEPGPLVGVRTLDEVRRHVRAFVALRRELDLVRDHLTDRALLEVGAVTRPAHGRKGLVQVGPDLAVRARRAERVAAGALRREELLAALRVPARRDPSGAATCGQEGDARESGEREPHRH